MTRGILTVENLIYVTLGFLSLITFAAMLGLHSGLSYSISRTAIANSLGTMFFLFIGIFICMILILQARASFGLQLPSFLVFILGGSLGLWASLTHRNPSPALTLARRNSSLLHVLCDHQFSAGADAGCLPVRCRRVRLYNSRHADSGHQ